MQSRYYNPKVGRFINEDITTSTGQRFVGCNMYAYCINNPINYLDSKGTDAVWIQEEDTVKVFGHTGLLVENEDGKWYFFYWGMDSEVANFNNIVSAIEGTDAKLVWKEIETTGCDLTTTDGVKKALMLSNDTNVNRSALVTDTLYFSGDFSDTFEFIDSLSKNPQKYNLLTRNCVQMSVYALQRSNRAFQRTRSVIPNYAYYKASILSLFQKVAKNFL